MTHAAVLLAAGGSKRLGFPKQLVRVQGQSLVRRCAEALLAAGSRVLVVVVGAHGLRVAEELSGLPVVVVDNTHWASGIASSIRAGVTGALTHTPDLDSILIALCDQPAIGATEFKALAALHEKSGVTVTAARYGGVIGVPAVFGKALFARLLELNGDEGARKIIAGQNPAILDLPEGLCDIDEPSDVERIRSLAEEPPKI